MGLPQLLIGGFDLVSFGLGFLNYYALYLAISLTLNLEFGFTGIPNFGKVMFIAGGAAFSGSIAGRVAAYAYGIGVNRDFIVFNPSIISGVNARLATDPAFAVQLVIFSLLVAALVGALLGYLSSYPAIRLREDYLGMLLLGAAQFFQVILRTYTPLIGGAQNIEVPDPYVYWSSLGPGYRDLVAALVVSAFAIVVFLYAERVAKSPLGRMLKSVRDNEDAAKALGKDDVAVRRNILIIASAIAGMAGAIFTFYIASVESDNWTRFAWTFWPFLIVIIGGAGNNFGVALGTFFFMLIFKGLQQIQPYVQPYIFFDVNWLQDILFAALLIIILLLRPEGIIREKPTPTLSRSTVAAMVGALAGPGGGGGTEPEEPSRLRRFGRRAKSLVRRGQKSGTVGPP
ncbi:MAG: branched-chain amino acid ABC transporter permease [Thaumarchaeota archaeon]|nr:branched-chain amino acid ABC transporter permease [Nitrososphaerota archaeon]